MLPQQVRAGVFAAPQPALITSMYILRERERCVSVLAGGFPRVLFPPLWCVPPCGVWLGLCVGRVDPDDDLASTGFHDCHQRTVHQPRPTRPRLATGARPSVPHHHPIRPRRVRTTSRPTSLSVCVLIYTYIPSGQRLQAPPTRACGFFCNASTCFAYN